MLIIQTNIRIVFRTSHLSSLVGEVDTIRYWTYCHCFMNSLRNYLSTNECLFFVGVVSVSRQRKSTNKKTWPWRWSWWWWWFLHAENKYFVSVTLYTAIKIDSCRRCKVEVEHCVFCKFILCTYLLSLLSKYLYCLGDTELPQWYFS